LHLGIIADTLYQLIIILYRPLQWILTIRVKEQTYSPTPGGIARILYVKELNIVAPAYTLIQGCGWPWPFNIKTRLKKQGLQKAGI
jgi:hypothetical protein